MLDRTGDRVTGALSLAAFAASLASCGGDRPAGLGVRDGRLAPCPSSPNCVSSDDTGAHAVMPFALSDSAHAVWSLVVATVRDMPRTRVVQLDSTYLHAEARSRVFRFVDDLELHLRPDQRLIAVRSAARAGRSDLGVNRRRVERLRRALQAAGVIR